MAKWTRQIAGERAQSDLAATHSATEAVVDEADRAEQRRLRIISIVFFCFLLFLIVRPHPGPADDAASRVALQAAIDAGGDTFRQIAYTAFFFAAVSLWIFYNGLKIPRGFSIAHLVLIAWFILSFTWAEDPIVSIKRSVLLLFVMTFIMIPIDIIGSRRTEKILYLLVASCLVVSLAAVPFFEFAKHPASESDASLIGNWRGIFQHKNVAGAVISMGIIVYVFRFINRANVIDAILILLSIVFLIGSRSKTPAGLLPIALAFGLVHRFMWRSSARRLIYAYGFLTLFAFLVLTIMVQASHFAQVLDNPDSFTGRAGIWQAVVAYWQDHKWLGAGYGSLFLTTIRPPIWRYENSPYQELMAHSHNGYLDLLAAVGIPGLALALISALIIPIYQIMTDKDENHVNENAMLLAILVMGLLENFMETQLYSKDKEIWTFFFISIIILQIRYRERRAVQTKASRRKFQRVPTGRAEAMA